MIYMPSMAKILAVAKFTMLMAPKHLRLPIPMELMGTMGAMEPVEPVEPKFIILLRNDFNLCPSLHYGAFYYILFCILL